MGRVSQVVQRALPLLALALLLPPLPGFQVGAAAAAPARGAAPPSFTRLPAQLLPSPRTVNLRSIGKAGGSARASQGWLAPVKTTAHPGGAAPLSAVEASSLFGALNLPQNEALYGQDQAVEPA